jgi:hypothetical protein
MARCLGRDEFTLFGSLLRSPDGHNVCSVGTSDACRTASACQRLCRYCGAMLTRDLWHPPNRVSAIFDFCTTCQSHRKNIHGLNHSRRPALGRGRRLLHAEVRCQSFFRNGRLHHLRRNEKRQRSKSRGESAYLHANVSVIVPRCGAAIGELH